MGICKVLVCLVLVVCSPTNALSGQQNPTHSSTETILSKLDLKMQGLERKLLELESTIKFTLEDHLNKFNSTLLEHRETIDERLTHHETISDGFFTSVKELSEMVGKNLTAVQNQLIIAVKKDRDLATQHLVRTNENLLGAIDQLSQVISQNLTQLETQSSSALDEHRDAINEKLSSQKTSLEDLQLSINGRIEKLDHKFIALQTQMINVHSPQETKEQKMWKQIQTLTSQKDLARFIISSGVDVRNISSQPCKDDQWKESGKYLIRASANSTPFLGYCDQFSFGGGWLVIQHRFDGSLDFYRNWTEYRNGFGSIDGEYWLGLEHLYQLTSRRYYELLIELIDFEGNYIYARYDEFEIGSAEDQYAMKELGSYSGTAGDSLISHRGMKFTTKDKDNDIGPKGNCAIEFEGAWWYSACHDSNLNGVYMNKMSGKAMVWSRYKKQLGLAYSRILIRLL